MKGLCAQGILMGLLGGGNHWAQPLHPSSAQQRMHYLGAGISGSAGVEIKCVKCTCTVG